MRIGIKVKAKSSRSELVKIDDSTYAAFLKSAPVEGAANEELIELLADEFDITKGLVTIVKGLHSKNKVVEIDN
ncbi:MAG: DUF167 domain-containing protein [Candidatus Omnitrophota bacterium]